jgi:cysteine synthase A
MICDSGQRYLDSYYDPQWLQRGGFDLEPYTRRLEDFYRSGLLMHSAP